MRLQLKEKQINEFKQKAVMETEREIYSIMVDMQNITINGSWSTERDETILEKNIVTAIENYCTKSNIEWEYNSTYSAWCD